MKPALIYTINLLPQWPCSVMLGRALVGTVGMLRLLRYGPGVHAGQKAEWICFHLEALASKKHQGSSKAAPTIIMHKISNAQQEKPSLTPPCMTGVVALVALPAKQRVLFI
jgi:hypothetical protein